MSLTHGAALEMEALEATMPCVTYREPYLVLETELSRLIRRLNERRISYTLHRRQVEPPFLWSWNAKLTIGERDYPFLTYREA